MEPSRSPALRSARAMVWGQLGRLADVGLNALWVFFITRQLAPAAYGRYVVLLGVVGVAGLVTSLGVVDVLGRFVPAYLARGDARSERAVLRWALAIRGCATLAGALAIVALAGVLATWLNQPELPRFAPGLALFLVVQAATETLTALYGSYLRLRATAAFRAAGQLAGLLTVVCLFAWRGPDLAVAMFGAGLTQGTTALLQWWGLRRAGPRQGPVAEAAPAEAAAGPAAGSRPDDSAGAGTWLRFALPVWASGLVTFGLAAQVDVLLIAALLPDAAQAGFYGLASLIAARVFTLATGWCAVLLPSAARSRALHGAAGLTAWFRLYGRLEVVALAPVFALLGATAPAVVRLFGEGYAPAGPLLAGTAWFALVSALLLPQVSLALLYTVDAQRWVLGLRIATGVLNVALDVALIPPLGPLGAVIATGLANALTHAAELVLACHFAGVRPSGGFLLRFGAATALAAAAPLWLAVETLPGLVAATALFGAGLAAGLWLFKPFEPADLDRLATVRPALGRLLRPFARAGATDPA